MRVMSTYIQCYSLKMLIFISLLKYRQNTDNGPDFMFDDKYDKDFTLILKKKHKVGSTERKLLN